MRCARAPSLTPLGPGPGPIGPIHLGLARAHLGPFIWARPGHILAHSRGFIWALGPGPLGPFIWARPGPIWAHSFGPGPGPISHSFGPGPGPFGPILGDSFGPCWAAHWAHSFGPGPGSIWAHSFGPGPIWAHSFENLTFLDQKRHVGTFVI